MYSQWKTGPRQTNGATANFGVGGIPSAGTAVPVATVSGNVMVTPRGLIHDFPQQAHSIGGASGFAPAAHFASPMVSLHDSLGLNYIMPMQSPAFQVRSTRRQQTAFIPPSQSPTFAVHGVPFSGGGQHHLGHQPRAAFAQVPSQAGVFSSQMGT